jgi:hypothetical protein
MGHSLCRSQWLNSCAMHVEEELPIGKPVLKPFGQYGFARKRVI